MAEANYRAHRDKVLAETHALEGQNLNLHVIDNKQRGGQVTEDVEKSEQGEKRHETGRKKQKAVKNSRLHRELKRISIQ